jgi:hypothetical protein
MTYVKLDESEDLARCQRYYEEFGGVSGEAIASGMAISSSRAYFPLTFKVVKAVTPTVTYSASSDFRVQNSAGGFVVGTMSQFSATPRGVGLDAQSVTGSPLTIVPGHRQYEWPRAGRGQSLGG